MGLGAGLLAGAMQSAEAQTVKHQRETNAGREARIQRTITETYAHRWEVVGGGGFLRFRSGDTLKKNTEVTWATSASYYLNPRLAVVGDARGAFGNAKIPNSQFNGVSNPQINEYFFMGGANYRFYTKEKFALSASGLAGAGWGIFSGGAHGLTYLELNTWQDGIRPAFAAELHADYNFYPNLGFRVAPTWTPTTFGGSFQGSNVGVNFGVIYRFGHQ
jgi:hypothetical protein